MYRMCYTYIMRTKNCQLNIRVTQEERNHITAKAAEYGIDFSTYLRLILKLGRLPRPQK